MIRLYTVVMRTAPGGGTPYIYEIDQRTGEPRWEDEGTVVNGTLEDAQAIAKLLNEQFNIELNNFWRG